MGISLDYIIVGGMTGFLVGLTGIGGGVLMTPILLLMFKTTVTTAVATDLLFAAITKISAIGIHYSHKQIDWKVVKRLWAGSLPLALFITVGIYFGKEWEIFEYIPNIIGYIIFFTSVRLVLSVKQTINVPHILEKGKFLDKNSSLLTILAGAIIGILVSLTSVGAGVLGTLVLLYLYPLMPPQNLIATEIAHAIPLAFLAGAVYFIFGKVDVQMLINLLIGSIPAAIMGSLLLKRISTEKLKIFLALVLLLGGIKLILH